MLTLKEHTRLRKIWCSALALIVHGRPNEGDEAHKQWMAAAPQIHEAFTKFLEDHDPYLTPKALVDCNCGRGADRGGVVGADEVPGANGL
jgi:hypothetical protein